MDPAALKILLWCVVGAFSIIAILYGILKDDD